MAVMVHRKYSMAQQRALGPSSLDLFSSLFHAISNKVKKHKEINLHIKDRDYLDLNKYNLKMSNELSLLFYLAQMELALAA
jgi:hypothetical protein